MTLLNNDILISGASSGFGRYLHEELKGSKIFKRDSKEKHEGIKTIIHTAWGGDTTKPLEYITGAISTYSKLLANPCEKLIFISTIDVYPKNKNLNLTEDLIINCNDIGIYGSTKLLVEQLIKNSNKKWLIIRPSCLLGRYTPNNNIRKISRGKNINIHICSRFNFITYQKVLYFILCAIYNNLEGIYNIASSNYIQLNEIDSVPYPKDGFLYNCGDINTQKLNSFYPELIDTSHNNYLEWKNNGY